MTNCLFAHGIAAVTGEMTVRFHVPVTVDSTAELVGTILSAHTPLTVAQAQLLQDGVVKATATAKFVKRTVGAILAGIEGGGVAEASEQSAATATQAQYTETGLTGEGGL
jgi:hypothetical protein